MRKDYQLALSDSKLVLQLTDPQNFDLSVFSDQPDDLFAGYSRADGQSGRIEYPIENMISLRELLNQITPGKQEACSLLNSLFSALNLGMKNQPVVLDLDGIFFSFHADALCLVRAPLVMECWMKRQEDLDCFIEQLLDHLDCDGFEISGLLWKARKESKPLEAILADLDSLNQASQKRKLFFRKPVIEPFSLKKPVYPDLEGRKQNMANPPQGQSDLSRSRNDPVSDRPAITRLQTENQLPSGKPDEAFSWLPQSGFDQKPENRPLPENDEQAGKEAICQPDLFGPAGKASDFSLDFQNWTSQDVLNFSKPAFRSKAAPTFSKNHLLHLQSLKAGNGKSFAAILRHPRIHIRPVSCQKRRRRSNPARIWRRLPRQIRLMAWKDAARKPCRQERIWQAEKAGYRARLILKEEPVQAAGWKKVCWIWLHPIGRKLWMGMSRRC